MYRMELEIFIYFFLLRFKTIIICNVLKHSYLDLLKLSHQKFQQFPYKLNA